MLYSSPPSLTDRQYERLADIIYQDSGIVISPEKRGLLMARLNRRLRALGLSDYDQYCKVLDSASGPSERRSIISAVTTNVTAFFREGHHFKALGNEIAPTLLSAAKRGERIRIWSAACSSGEEPYSIAITLLEAAPELARHDFLILATDIDPEMVDRAEAGVFSASSIKTVDKRLLEKYFREANGNFEIIGSVKKMMRFAELNLHTEWPFSGKFDVILCRNVVIYFDKSGRRLLWSRMAEILKPNGHLFIGHSERIDDDAIASFALAGPTHYVKRGHNQSR